MINIPRIVYFATRRIGVMQSETAPRAKTRQADPSFLIELKNNVAHHIHNAPKIWVPSSIDVVIQDEASEDIGNMQRA